MRARRLPLSLAALAVTLLSGACADPTSAPPARAEAALDPHAGHAADLALTPGVGMTLAAAPVNVEAMGGWIERFDLNSTNQDTWIKPVALWLPTNPASIPISVNGPHSLADWSIVKQVRDRGSWYQMESMYAWHDGDTCNAPPLVHALADYDQSVFFCRNHMMTAVNAAGYGVTYLTPNRMVRIPSGGTAVVRFDVATLRHSGRDWIDLWVTPYADNLVVPLEDSLPDAQGYPRNAVHVRMRADRNRSIFTAEIIRNGSAAALAQRSQTSYEEAFVLAKAAGIRAVDTTSATIRDAFELHISNDRLRFGMPVYDLWWVDTEIPGGLGWAEGVVQLGHHSFSPTNTVFGCQGKSPCGPTTWHWDNVGIAPAVPFTIINATTRYAHSRNPDVTLTRAVPPQGGYLRFTAHGEDVEVSFNGAKSADAARQYEHLNVPDRVHSYWTPIPAGTTTISFKAKKDKSALEPSNRDEGAWIIRDIAVWAQ
jgi:hypothetical protein